MAKPSPSHSGAHELVAVGKAIRSARNDLGISQEALANEIGIDRSYMGGVERGQHNLALVNLIKISKALGLSGSELLSKAKL